MGTGTTNVAAARYGRNSVGYEIDDEYFGQAVRRMTDVTAGFFDKAKVELHGKRSKRSLRDRLRGWESVLVSE